VLRRLRSLPLCQMLARTTDDLPHVGEAELKDLSPVDTIKNPQISGRIL
jgi:hypothetical protein